LVSIIHPQFLSLLRNQYQSMPRILTIVLAVAAGMFVSNNRLLFGPSSSASSEQYAAFIKGKDDVLNYYLEKHRKQIGDDFVPYRNHCLRVLAFTKYHLAQAGIEIKPHIHNILAMSLAYHDIALWSDGALNYLEPSVAQMKERVSEEMKSSKQAEGDEGTGYVPEVMHWSSFEKDAEIAKAVILYHHKYTDYDAKTEDDIAANRSAAELESINEIVNAVRKADWADATMGIIRYGLPQDLLVAAYNAIPEAGFHKMLLNMGSRLSPDSLVGQLDVLNIFKW
jgi:hypothetical protein